MAKVTIYTTPTCSFCKMAKSYFEENNVDFEERDVTTNDASLNEMVEKSGQMGVPVIEIDGKVVVGFNKEKLKGLLGLS